MEKKLFHVLFLPLALFGAALVLTGCDHGKQEDADVVGPVRLSFLCGAGIRPPIDGIGEEGGGVVGLFRYSYPELHIGTTFGASNLLLGQLKLTMEGDLFLPGDDFYIEEAKKEGLIYETRTVALFVPVIMVQNGNPLGIEKVADLADPDVKLAIADERAAAIGRIMPEIFRKNGIDINELTNIEFTGVTVPEIAQAVDLGHVDATLVWRPVAMQYPDAAVIDIDEDKNVTSPLVVAVLETSENKTAALKFADFMSGAEGREVFSRYHYDSEL